EQRFRLLQNRGAEALRKPAVNRREQIASFGALALVAPQPGEAARRTQLPELRALLLRDRDRLAIAGLGRRGIVHRQQHLSGMAKRLGLKPSYFFFLRQPARLGEVGERRVPLAGHPAGVSQKRQRPRCKEDDRMVTKAGPAGGDERNALVGAPQS